jgi:hypothetical protein
MVIGQTESLPVFTCWLVETASKTTFARRRTRLWTAGCSSMSSDISKGVCERPTP